MRATGSVGLEEREDGHMFLQVDHTRRRRQLKYLMKACMHTCRKDQTHIIDFKLKNKIKELVCLNIEQKYIFN